MAWSLGLWRLPEVEYDKEQFDKVHRSESFLEYMRRPLRQAFSNIMKTMYL